jgi:hypothetical protein
MTHCHDITHILAEFCFTEGLPISGTFWDRTVGNSQEVVSDSIHGKKQKIWFRTHAPPSSFIFRAQRSRLPNIDLRYYNRPEISDQRHMSYQESRELVSASYETVINQYIRTQWRRPRERPRWERGD